MLSLELSSYLLEVRNDAYTTLEINEKATLNINMLYSENRLLKIAARDKAVLYFSLWPGVV